MAFTAADVKNLREMTGVGMMDCKKALVASDGDMDKAVEYLREKGLAASAKKAGRIAAEGMAYAAVIDGVGVVVEVNAETDFVGKNEKFVDFVKGVAATVAEAYPEIETSFSLADPLLPENSGTYAFRGDGTVYFSKRGKAPKVTVEELTQALIGYHPSALPEALRCFPTGIPYMHTMLNK